jgi:hypothetical protein
MSADYREHSSAEAPFAAETPHPVANGRRETGVSASGVLLAFLGAAGMTAGVTVLYRAMRVIMQTEGGFVATGGPYEIAHPAPGWVWLIPLSIMAAVGFTLLHAVASYRGWGVNLMVFLWTGLFVSLGWNFLELGWRSPHTGAVEWGWLVPGVVFWVMGLAPLGLLTKTLRAFHAALIGRQANPDVLTAWRLPAISGTRRAYVFAQILGVAAGVAGGLALFGAIAG